MIYQTVWRTKCVWQDVCVDYDEKEEKFITYMIHAWSSVKINTVRFHLSTLKVLRFIQVRGDKVFRFQNL